jgi:hypothetical protein
MSNETSVRQWIANFNMGCYSNDSTSTQIDAGWFDWFCKTPSLRNKTYKLAVKVKLLAKSSKINQDTMYVWFKNNCPMVGKLYDDFRFADIETGDVVYTIVPKSGHTHLNGCAEVWGKENNFEEPLVLGTWKDVRAFFGV